MPAFTSIFHRFLVVHNPLFRDSTFIPCHSMHLPSTLSQSPINYTPPPRALPKTDTPVSGLPVTIAFFIKYILFFTLSLTSFSLSFTFKCQWRWLPPPVVPYYLFFFGSLTLPHIHTYTPIIPLAILILPRYRSHCYRHLCLIIVP